MQKERAKIYEGERVDIKKKNGKTTRSDTLRLQGTSERNWGNLEERVGRTTGTVPEYVQSNAGSPVSPGAMMADKPQLKLLCFKERFFPSNMKSMSLQISLCVQLEHWKSIPKYRQSLNI